MPRILIIEDDKTFCKILSQFLVKNNFQVEIHHNLKKGTEALLSGRFELILLDYRLPDGTGLELLQHSHFYSAKVPAIIMTSFLDIRTAVKAIKSGAFEYITKPVNPDELLMVIHEALAKAQKTPARSPADTSDRVMGQSEVSRQIHSYIDLVSPTDMSVLIQGESGTGKEYVARAIHRLSRRAEGPFVALDCGALSKEIAGSELFGHVKGAFTNALQNKKGQFEMADTGTLFLDEIGNLDYEIQVKLLRALQEHTIQPIGSNHLTRINVRILAATNEDLYEEVKNGKFREDLYHRINEFKIKVPPLRERDRDIELFTAHFLKEANQDLDKQVEGFSPEVQRIFNRYDWPGNLRELKNVVKRAVLLTGEGKAGIEALPEEMVGALKTIGHPKPDTRADKEKEEKQRIIDTLEKTRYNKSKAAQLLNIDRKTLYNKLAKYNIEG